KYKDRLVDDILRFTFTPDSNDDSFAGNRSGESMKYKLMASDNLRAEQERMFKTGIMRRLRLVSNIWSIRGNESTAYDLVNQTNIIFTPNVPKTNNEIVAMAQQLYGMVSNQTVYEMLSAVTGLDADVEIKRMEEINAEKRFDKVEVLGDGQEERKP
ncbi:phage portal protein, partial [Escherichia coli]|nr:phage portal protein [Escherichia coli]